MHGADGKLAGDDSPLHKISSFDELAREGYVPFSVGPLYVYCGVERSLVEAFIASEHDKDMYGRDKEIFHTTMRFEHPVVGQCEFWNYILDVMDFWSYQWFKKWMLSLQFLDHKKKNFYVPRHYLAPVADPIIYGQHRQKKPATLDVFSPASIRWTITPRTGLTDLALLPATVVFNSTPPIEEVRTLGLQMLKG